MQTNLINPNTYFAKSARKIYRDVLTFDHYMRKYVWLIIILLAAGGAYYYFNQSNAPIVNEKNFAMADTDAVTKISLVDRERHTVVLSKKEDKWYVNDTFEAFTPSIDLFLNETIKKLRVKGPVPKPAQDNTIRKMVGKAVHVKIYEGEEMVRDFYVGEATPEKDASYLHINGSRVPYLAHILGYNSILYPKFSTDVHDWYNRSVFDYTPEEIQSVSINYLREPNQSFTLTCKDSTYTIQPSIPNLNQVAAKSYFAMFSFKNFEGYAEYLTQETKDTIKAQTPHIQLTLKLTDGSEKQLNLFQKKSGNGNTLVDKKGHVIVEDTERYFATFTGFPYLVTVQEYNFGKLLVKRSYWQ